MAAPSRPQPDQPTPAEAQLRLRHGLTVAALSLLVMALSYVILRELTQILRPLMVAVFVCYLIAPAHHWLVRHRLPSTVSYCVIVGTFLGLMYAVGSLAYPNIVQVSKELPSYVVNFQRVTNDFLERIRDRWDKDDHAPAQDDLPASEAVGNLTTAPTPEERKYGTPSDLVSFKHVISLGQSTVETFVGLFAGSMVVVFYLIFLLAEQAHVDQRVINAFGREKGKRILVVVGKINAAVSRYIAVKTFVSLLIAGLSFLILSLFGVRHALVWGLLTFFANFVPYVGSMVAVALPIGICFLQFDQLWIPTVVASLLIVAQQIVGNVIEPRVIGRELGVSPLVILLSLAFWGLLWGIPGMIMSAPLVVTVKIILENIESTQPIAKLFSDV